MEEGLKFTPEEVTIALSQCDRAVQLEVEVALLRNRVASMSRQQRFDDLEPS